MFSENVLHQLSSAIQFCAAPKGAVWIEIAGYEYGVGSWCKRLLKSLLLKTMDGGR